MKNEITKTLKLFTEDFLYNYQFQFNDEEFRDEVKKGLDKICELF